MKKTAILFLTIIFLSQFAQAQPDLIPYRVGDKWGYCDTLMNVIIPVQYDGAQPFGVYEEKLASVKIGNQNVIINKAGEIQHHKDIEEIFTIVKDGFAFSPGSKYELAEQLYYEKDRILVKNKETQLFGFLDKKGIEIIPCIYKKAKIFYNDYVPVCVDSKWGLINKNGDEVLSFEYDDVIFFYSQRFFIKNKKWGALNKTGEITIGPKYDTIFVLTNDKEERFAVKSKGLWGVVDSKDVEIIPIKYDKLVGPLFGSGNVILAQRKKKWGVLYPNGEIFIDFLYEDVENKFRHNDNIGNEYIDGVVMAKFNDRWGVVGKDNQVLLDFQYDYVYVGAAKPNPYVHLENDGKNGVYFINEKVLIPCKYDEPLSTFYKGISWVIYQGKPGYIDTKGREYWKD